MGRSVWRLIISMISATSGAISMVIMIIIMVIALIARSGAIAMWPPPPRRLPV